MDIGLMMKEHSWGKKTNKRKGIYATQFTHLRRNRFNKNSFPVSHYEEPDLSEILLRACFELGFR